MVTASYGHYSHRAARIEPDSTDMPDPTSRVRFSSVFPKKAWIILCKTDPDPFWVAWSGFGQTHLVWKQAGVQESSGPVSGRTQPARYQCPTLPTRLRSSTDVPDVLCKTSPDPDLVLADCVRFWPNGSGPEAQAGVQESSGPLPANASQPMRIGSGMFTGFSPRKSSP